MLAPLFALAITFFAGIASPSDEISLFDSFGRPSAYIADDLTIYLWSGKPVAYLSSGTNGTDVYGFNGKHLGWFEKGYIRNNDGDAACGVKAVMPSTQAEPFKSFKEFKPFKAFREFAPFKPCMKNSWSSTPCRIVLGLGASDSE